MPDYHKYVIRRYVNPNFAHEWGLGIYYGHTQSYTVLDYHSGAAAGVYGADPRRPPVMLTGGINPSVLIRTQDSPKSIDWIPEKEFLRTSHDGRKYFTIAGYRYYWRPRLDSAGRVKYTIQAPNGSDILAELEVNSQSYESWTDPMRLRVLNPDVYELQDSRIFYAVLASIVVLCKNRDPWVTPSGLCP